MSGRTVQQNIYDDPEQYNVNGNRAFNQFTRNHYDVCEYENELRIGSKPMKYYVNQLNTPQTNTFQEFTVIGNQKQYNVRNDYERPLPTRLNPIYPSYVLPYQTTPYLANTAPSREYTDTSTNLRFGNDSFREKKSSVALGEIDLNRWNIGVSEETVQNAGQFNPDIPGAKMQQSMGSVGGGIWSNRDESNIKSDGYYNPYASNNVLFANSAWPPGGISSRNQMHNYMNINNC